MNETEMCGGMGLDGAVRSLDRGVWLATTSRTPYTPTVNNAGPIYLVRLRIFIPGVAIPSSACMLSHDQEAMGKIRCTGHAGAGGDNEVRDT